MSCISWERYASGKRYVLSSVALADVTHAEFQADGLDEPQSGEYATVDLCCESKLVCFQYELLPKHIHFVSTLHRLVQAVAVVRDLPNPRAPAQRQRQQLEATASESARPVSELFRSQALQSLSSASFLGARDVDLDKFKLQLQDGILVEKVGVCQSHPVRQLSQFVADNVTVVVACLLVCVTSMDVLESHTCVCSLPTCWARASCGRSRRC